MREIKFRGQLLSGLWVYGLLAKDNNGDYFISNSAGRPFAYKIRPETVGQYTGLKDRNGKEIYEGDIISIDIEVQQPNFVIQDDYELGVVEWDHSGLAASVQTDDGKMFTEIDHGTTVIGNIYDNPELLD